MSVPMATNSGHTNQTHSRLPERDSGPSISTKSAHNNRVESPPRNSGASSTGDRCSVRRLAGEVDVHVSTVSPAQQSHSDTTDQPGGRSDTNSPWWPSQLCFPHPLCLCVDHSLIIPYHRTEQGYVSDGKSYHRTHGGSHAALPSSKFLKIGL